MKIRTGFVSNSSSSSYVILMNKSDLTVALSKVKMNKTQELAMKNLLEDVTIEFKDIVVLNMKDTSEDPERDSFYKAMKSVKENVVRGCNHPLSQPYSEENDKFCPKCGKPLWVEDQDLDRNWSKRDAVGTVFYDLLSKVGKDNYKQVTTHEG